MLFLESESLDQTIQKYLQQEQYGGAIAFLESLISTAENPASARLLLGILYVLVEQEEAAQLTWALVFSEVEDTEEEALTVELQRLFRTVLDTLKSHAAWSQSWQLYQYLWELFPPAVDTAIGGLQAALEDESLQASDLERSGLVPSLEQQTELLPEPQQQQLRSLLERIVVWDHGDLSVLQWIEAVAQFVDDLTKTAFHLCEKSIQLRLQSKDLQLVLAYIETGLKLDEHPFGFAHERVVAHVKYGQYMEAVRLAEELKETCDTIQYKILAQGLLIDALLHIPDQWQQAQACLEEIVELYYQLLTEYDRDPDIYFPAILLLRPLFFHQYIQDTPQQYRALLNQLSAAYVDSVKSMAKSIQADAHQATQEVSKTKSKIRVGFLSECMRRHSVGWLSRWIFQHYDRDRFEFYVYFLEAVGEPTDPSPFSQKWFANPATAACTVHGDPQTIAQILQEDQLDILVDLDSLTSEKGYSVMALKPAPVQVTWLGYDATSLPTIDYFLADEFVLPPTADSYYVEKIWRMPQTYIAVDGFEVGVPTLRRRHLGIPEKAVVYYSAQSAQKRHLETTRWQVQILKQVPNSHLLIKGKGDADAIRNAYLQVAAAEGVSGDRFHLLPRDFDEPTHRANMSIADVVLDTFPYTGATTTMEALWMGMPLVTRVGQQFASRNSYTMLRNAGITAGIAHSAEEYIDWGVRYGLNAELREQVRWQLWQSRQTAPLWDAAQFTRHLEYALEQMWQRYLAQAADEVRV